jgi:hypothetical protein
LIQCYPTGSYNDQESFPNHCRFIFPLYFYKGYSLANLLDYKDDGETYWPRNFLIVLNAESLMIQPNARFAMVKLHAAQDRKNQAVLL